MYKILPVNKIQEADQFTIDNEPIASVDLMERAVSMLVTEIENHFEKETVFTLVCGPGNNGGDGLALARLLHHRGYDCNVYLWKAKKLSEDNQINYNRLKEIPAIPLHIIQEASDIPDFKDGNIIIDALFGSGLTREIQGLPAKIIEQMNATHIPIISIDIPSGLFVDQSNLNKKGAVVRPWIIYTFQFPKLSLLLPENEVYNQNWMVIPIGLHPDYIQQVACRDFLLEAEDINHVLHVRKKFSHKGNYGHALLIAGSKGKMGAAVLSAKACMRTGVGLLTAHIPQRGEVIIQTAVPEVMVDLDEHMDYITGITLSQSFSAIGIGPGIGKNKATENMLKLLIQNHQHTPLIIDADGINILSENKTWLSFLPKDTIITPHPKEFERLAGKSSNNFQRLEKQRELSVKYAIFIVLKGAHTSISCPDGTVYFNNTGNPGMATAGSGDVLMGMILSLLGQGYTAKQACVIGVWMHGLSGDKAMQKKGVESLMASDIIQNIYESFLDFR